MSSDGRLRSDRAILALSPSVSEIEPDIRSWIPITKEDLIR